MINMIKNREEVVLDDYCYNQKILLESDEIKLFEILILIAAEKKTIEYMQLIDKTNVEEEFSNKKLTRATIGRKLGNIALFCYVNNLPIISAIVVRKGVNNIIDGEKRILELAKENNINIDKEIIWEEEKIKSHSYEKWVNFLKICKIESIKIIPLNEDILEESIVSFLEYAEKNLTFNLKIGYNILNYFLLIFNKKIYAYGTFESWEKSNEVDFPVKINLKDFNVFDCPLPVDCLNVKYKYSNQKGGRFYSDFKFLINYLKQQQKIENKKFPFGEKASKYKRKLTKSAGTKDIGQAKTEKGEIAEDFLLNRFIELGFEENDEIRNVANSPDRYWDIDILSEGKTKGLEIKNITNSKYRYFHLSTNEEIKLINNETRLCLVDTNKKIIWVSRNYNNLKVLNKVINYQEDIRNYANKKHEMLFVTDIRIYLYDEEIDGHKWEEDFIEIYGFTKNEILAELFN